MNDRVAKLLRDAVEHGERGRTFVADYTFAQYKEFDLLRSGVERELSIVGEALQQMRRLDPQLADSIPEIAEVIGLRSRLVHGYHQTDDRVIYDTMREPSPTSSSGCGRFSVMTSKLRDPNSVIPPMS